MPLFGTNGVRGKIDALTPMLAFELSASFATWCKGKSILIGRDMRKTGPLLHSAAKAGILSAGKDATDLGLVSSPVAEFAMEQEKAGGLIIVTASHNTAEWNALKFVDGDGVAVSRERGAEIENLAKEKKFRKAKWDKVGTARAVYGIAEMHASYARKFIDFRKIKNARLKAVLDFGNGTSALSKGFFTSLGMEIIPLNEKIDGIFPGRPSEPTEANVKGLCREVAKQSADFGVAWDGDSDRVVFVDEKGKWLVGDIGFAISAKRAAEEKKANKEKFVITTVATSRAVEEACAPLGAKTIYTKVGAPYLAEKLFELKGRAVSAGEEVGGIVWPDFSLAKDGIFAAGKIAEMVAEGRKLSGLAGELPEYHNSKCKIDAVGDAKKSEGLKAAKKHAEESGGKLTLIDGVRVDFEEGWAIVRASGTENAMRVFAEAKTKNMAEELMKEYEEIVKEAVSG